MRIGIQFDTRGPGTLASRLADFARAEEEGFDSIWLGQVFEHDALTLLALAGTCTRRVGLGVSVVPLPSRHVATLAQQALTTQLATKGRLCLGVGAGHGELLERKLGLPGDRPLTRTREALEILRPLLRGETVRHEGATQRVRIRTPVAGAAPPELLLAALGPRMIDLAAELADGVSLVYAGAAFVTEQVRPRLPDGARIVASLPVAVTDQPAATAAAIDEFTGPSAALPAYQRALRRQEVERVSELACLGSPAEVDGALDALAASGVTDLNPILISTEADPACGRRTRDFLADRAQRTRA